MSKSKDSGEMTLERYSIPFDVSINSILTRSFGDAG